MLLMSDDGVRWCPVSRTPTCVPNMCCQAHSMCAMRVWMACHQRPSLLTPSHTAAISPHYRQVKLPSMTHLHPWRGCLFAQSIRRGAVGTLSTSWLSICLRRRGGGAIVSATWLFQSPHSSHTDLWCWWRPGWHSLRDELCHVTRPSLNRKPPLSRRTGACPPGLRLPSEDGILAGG